MRCFEFFAFGLVNERFIKKLSSNSYSRFYIMSLEKKALARIIIFDPKTRKNFWQGTVYRNRLHTAKEIVEKVKEALK